MCPNQTSVFLLFARVAYVMATMPHFISYFNAGHHTLLYLFLYSKCPCHSVTHTHTLLTLFKYLYPIKNLNPINSSFLNFPDTFHLSNQACSFLNGHLRHRPRKMEPYPRRGRGRSRSRRRRSIVTFRSSNQPQRPTETPRTRLCCQPSNARGIQFPLLRCSLLQTTRNVCGG